MRSANEDLVQRLRGAGLRITTPRLEVLRALTEGPAHIDADRIAAAVRARTGSMAAQTVYNVLASLVAAGLVRRIEPARGPGLYELRVADNHHHIVCRRCAATADVDCQAMPAPCLTPSDTHGFLVDQAEVMYWGLCPACVAATSVPSQEVQRPRSVRHRRGDTALDPEHQGQEQ